MRKGAGILMIILAMALPYIAYLGGEGVINNHSLFIIIIVPGALLVTGGVACHRRRYWRLCFTAGLFAIFVMIFWLGFFGESLLFSLPMLCINLFFIAAGIFSMIFVSLRRREWQKAQA
jgi:hypothetical protein